MLLTDAVMVAYPRLYMLPGISRLVLAPGVRPLLNWGPDHVLVFSGYRDEQPLQNRGIRCTHYPLPPEELAELLARVKEREHATYG